MYDIVIIFFSLIRTFVGSAEGLGVGFPIGLIVGSGGPVGLGVVKQTSYAVHGMELQQDLPLLYFFSCSGASPPQGSPYLAAQSWTHL